MKYLQTYESIIKNLFSKEKKLITSDYEVIEKDFSKIDPTKEIITNVYMICPVCKQKMDLIQHGEIRTCKKCKTRMQVFSNSLTINVSYAKEDPYKDRDRYDTILDSLPRYTNNYTEETLRIDDYLINKNTIECPLCKHKNKFNNKYQVCVNCGLKMDVTSTSHFLNHSVVDFMLCTIDNENLEFYSNLKKYNL